MKFVLPALTCLALTMSLPLSPAKAVLVDGNTLHTSCSSGEGSSTYAQDVTFCRAYIMGTYDDFMASRQMEEKPSCQPEGLANDKIVDTILETMRDQPAFNDSFASNKVRASIIAAWPACSMATSQGQERSEEAAERSS